jgi:hypothetical protein
VQAASGESADASSAVHVTVVVPIGNVEPDGGSHTTVTPGQLSDATGGSKFTMAPATPGSLGTVISSGHVMTGASVSWTVMVKLHVLVFPAASVAVSVTVVVPFGKKLPEAGLAVTKAPQLSEAVGAGKFTTAPHWFGLFETVMFAGHVMVGGSVSTTVTLKVHCSPDLVLHVTVVVPFGKKEPDAGEQTTPPQRPVAMGAKVTTAPHCCGSFETVMLAGHVRIHPMIIPSGSTAPGVPDSDVAAAAINVKAIGIRIHKYRSRFMGAPSLRCTTPRRRAKRIPMSGSRRHNHTRTLPRKLQQ